VEPEAAKYKLAGLADGRISLTTVGRRFEPFHIHPDKYSATEYTMRNILQYPLTVDETRAAVQYGLRAYQDSRAIGGMHGMALHTLDRFLEINGELYANFLAIEHAKFVASLPRSPSVD
jgi:hypothetical protein